MTTKQSERTEHNNKEDLLDDFSKLFATEGENTNLDNLTQIKSILDTTITSKITPQKNISKFKVSFDEEYDNEDDIAKSLLKELSKMIKKELESKQKNRGVLVWFLIVSFAVLGIFMMCFLWKSNEYETPIVLAVVSGFFVNMIGLVIILVKYMFSPSKEIYDYTINIFKRKENGSENKQDEI